MGMLAGYWHVPEDTLAAIQIVRGKAQGKEDKEEERESADNDDDEHDDDDDDNGGDGNGAGSEGGGNGDVLAVALAGLPDKKAADGSEGGDNGDVLARGARRRAGDKMYRPGSSELTRRTMNSIIMIMPPHCFLV